MQVDRVYLEQSKIYKNGPEIASHLCIKILKIHK